MRKISKVELFNFRQKIDEAICRVGLMNRFCWKVCWAWKIYLLFDIDREQTCCFHSSETLVVLRILINTLFRETVKGSTTDSNGIKLCSTHNKIKILKLLPHRWFYLRLHKLNYIQVFLLIVMIKTKDTGYLFAKMSSEENGVSHIVVGEQKGAKSQTSSSRTYSFEQSNETEDKQQTFTKWLLDNVMLLLTLIGVLSGVITGAQYISFFP